MLVRGLTIYIAGGNPSIENHVLTCLIITIERGKNAKRSIFERNFLMGNETPQEPTLYDLSKKWSSGVTRNANTLALIVDAIIAGSENAMAVFDKTPKGGDPNPLRVEVERGIVASFGAKAITLSESNTKELSDTDKATKRYNRQQVGSRLSKVKQAVHKRLNPDSGSKGRTDDNVAIPRMIAELKARIQSSETFNGDLVALSEWVEKCPLDNK
tara:strand:+ start:267 stop:908 length:642 start_codon:yes stop_codon:yes gene_type:complete